MKQPTKLPEWKQAVDAFMALDPKPGDTVSRRWLEEQFCIRRPIAGTYEDIQAFDLKFLKFFDRFKDALMHRHHVQFHPERDKALDAWRVVAPDEIAAICTSITRKELSRTIRKALDRTVYTDLSGLSQEQLRRHVEVQIRLSMKRQAIDDVEREPLSIPELPQATPRFPKGDMP